MSGESFTWDCLSVHLPSVCVCLWGQVLTWLGHKFMLLAPPQHHGAWDISAKCFPHELFRLAPVQLCIRRLITQPGDQKAHPGIVPLSVFGGVSLQPVDCGSYCAFVRHNLERGGVFQESLWQQGSGPCFYKAAWLSVSLHSKASLLQSGSGTSLCC